jgi:hypothetical protein
MVGLYGQQRPMSSGNDAALKPDRSFQSSPACMTRSTIFDFRQYGFGRHPDRREWSRPEAPRPGTAIGNSAKPNFAHNLPLSVGSPRSAYPVAPERRCRSRRSDTRDRCRCHRLRIRTPYAKCGALATPTRRAPRPLRVVHLVAHYRMNRHIPLQSHPACRRAASARVQGRLPESA